MVRIVWIVLSIAVVFVMMQGCKKSPKPNILGEENLSSAQSSLDLTDIEESGELIAVTFNGPDTYYEYRNTNTGLQYTMAEQFANHLGLRLRMEVAKDTTELVLMLKESKADLIACELPAALIQREGLKACGANNGGLWWAIRRDSPELEEELNLWYSNARRVMAQTSMRNALTNRFKVQRSRAVFYSKSAGIVSDYDALFLRASRLTGWDWQLLASQCYQESGFDAQAVSWAGARGLMQVMPSTAAMFGVGANELFNPETNVMTAARVIVSLENKFAAIRNPLERKKFVLAAYNGGYGHIADAMQLARKYGRNPYLWSDVSYFVLHLSEPRYYKDAVVRYGYMIGSETYNYVNSVMMRWTGYNAVLHNALPKIGITGLSGQDNYKKNRYSKRQTIISKDDSLFRISK